MGCCNAKESQDQVTTTEDNDTLHADCDNNCSDDDDDDDDDTFSASRVLFDRAPPHTGTPATAMLMVDRDVDPEGLLATAAKPNVVIVEFDDDEDSTAELIAKIDAAYTANGSTQFKTIAFANHGGDVWQLATDCKCVPGQDGYIEDILPVMSALVRCTAKGGRIDLLGCDLLDLDPHMPDKLEQKFEGIKFTASDDKTGNPRAGGDWVMESEGDLDISFDYFDQDKLKAYNEVMWGPMDALDFIPVVGAVARTGQAAVYLAQGDTEGAKTAALNAGMNLLGDVATVATGGASKVASVSAKVGMKAAARAGAKAAARAVAKAGAKQGTKEAAKIALKAGTKAAVKGFVKGARKNLTKSLKKRYIKKYVKKQIKREVKQQIEDIWNQIKEEQSLPKEFDELIEAISQATGITVDDVEQMTTEDFLFLTASIGEQPEESHGHGHHHHASHHGHHASHHGHHASHHGHRRRH